MANTLPVQKFINVSITITPSAAQGPNLNSLMIVGDSNVINVGERYRQYAGLTDVATDFGDAAPEYLAAETYFDQTPTPPPVLIGRWAQSATAGQLICGPLSAANQQIAPWNAIANGTFLVYEDGVPRNVTGLSFAGDTNLNGVAATIQTALVALEANSTVVYNANFERFELTSGTTGVSSTMSFLQTSAASGSASFTGQPAANDTLTIDGTVVTFVAGAPAANQVQIGATLPVTLANLLALLNASADANLKLMTYSVVGSVLYVVSKATGATGNAYTLAKTSTEITVSGATLTGGVAGTDISAMMVGTNVPTSGSYVSPGVAAESALSAVQAIEAVYSNFYGLTFAAGLNNADVADSDHIAIAGYVEGDGNRHLYGVTTAEGAAIVTGDTTSIGARLKALSYQRSFCQWSSKNPYAVCSLFALGCNVNFNGSDTTITFMWKTEPGVVAENLNETQAGALDANNYNYFAAVNNGTAITVNGTVAAGFFIDEVWNADWFGSAIQTALFNAMFTTTTKIPQTDPGNHVLNVTMKQTCEQARTNGFLAPGTWNSGGFGQIKTGDFLPDGYYIYQPPISSQSQSARKARQSVPFQIAAKEAGAVHDVVVGVTVNQ